jgi:hypothetical protein
MITSCSHFFSHHGNRGVDFGGCGIAFDIVVANDNTVLLVELILVLVQDSIDYNSCFLSSDTALDGICLVLIKN